MKSKGTVKEKKKKVGNEMRADEKSESDYLGRYNLYRIGFQNGYVLESFQEGNNVDMRRN